MQDIAGARVVADVTRSEQDKLVEAIIVLFPGAKVVDRRAKPSHGYRAVHVVVRIDDHLVEIQVRTELQNRWAQLVERLADQWGRQIRYGEPPLHPDARVGSATVTRQRVVDLVMQVAGRIDRREGGVADLQSLALKIEQEQVHDPYVMEALAQARARSAEADKALEDALHGLESIFGVERPAPHIER